MEKLRNLSLKKSFILYMVIGLVGTYFLSAIVIHQASYTQQMIWQKYVDGRIAYGAVSDGFMQMTPRPSTAIMSEGDMLLSELCDFLQTYTILLLSVIGTCVDVFLFYHNKLKAPIEELNIASKRIAENDFEFRVMYENQDEMGVLCRGFEQMREQLIKMRGQLMQNNQILWKSVEEERALRAAIAHDIRSPLSVLKGYQEMLIEYIPDKTIDTDRALEMLQAGMRQIERMDVFVETIRKMSSLESRELLREEVTAGELGAEIQEEVDILAKDKKVQLEVPVTEEIFMGDRAVILEVVENILTNALRYAEALVKIEIFLTKQELRVCVEDDGCGFMGAPGKVNVKDSLKHSGLGMYISRLYCERHGGKLLFENNAQGGAAVTAVFR